MAAIDFPAAPVDGQIFQAANGVIYQWNAAKTLWLALPNFSTTRSAYNERNDYFTLSPGVVALNDTVVTNASGTEILAVSYTPTSVASRVRVRGEFWGSSDNAQSPVLILCNDKQSNALQTQAQVNTGANSLTQVTAEVEHVPGLAVPIRYAMRLGVTGAANWQINGFGGGRVFGGVNRCHLVVEEIVPWFGGASLVSNSVPVLLQTQNIVAGQATADFTGLTSAYRYYEWRFHNVRPTADNTTFEGRISQDNGATWKAAGGNYASEGSGITDALNLQGPGANNTNVSPAPGVNGIFWMSNPADTTWQKMCRSLINYVATSTGALVSINASMRYVTDTNAINGMRFFFSGTTFSSGAISMWGIP